MADAAAPVLIVGAGPSGLTAALLLHRLGVPSMIVERRAGDAQRAPAAHVVNARTLEIFRAADVDSAALVAAAKNTADSGLVYWVTKFGGEVLGRLPYERQGDDQLAVTPTPLRNISQSHLEPILLDTLRAMGCEQPRWRQQWESVEQDEVGVVSRVRDLETDQVSEVRSEYLIAADGAGSRIRKALGIDVHGPQRIQSFVMIHFLANVRRLIGDPPGILHFVCDADAGGAAIIVHDPDGEAVLMHAFDPDAESLADYDAERCAEIVRSVLQDPGLDFEIATIATWAMTAQVAERYSEGRSFLVGDAAHRFPPTGGLGLNSGVQDVHNLAWKLAFVRRGLAPASLLASYESERRPVAQTNADQSLANAFKLIEVPIALGMTDDVAESRANVEATLASPAGRQRVAEAIDNQAEHFDMPGLQLGYSYESGVVVHDSDDGEAPPIDVRNFTPSGRPGARLPHAWVGSGDRRESILDWVPLDRFVLIAAAAGDAWVEAVSGLGTRPLEVRVIREGELADLETWLTQAGIGKSGALLVRPDQHIAWRTVDVGADPQGRLRVVLDALLGLQA